MLKIVKGGFLLNGQKETKLLGRSAFKLANIVTYHFTGDGGGDKGWNSLGYVEAYVGRQQALFGENVVLRVLLETAGWSPTDDGMFGGVPRDQGFWERERLRDGRRERDMHPVGTQVLEYLYKLSHETGVVFELVIDATLKGDDIPKGEIDHVIRVVGIRMGGLNEQYPKALIIPNCRNEWGAHNGSKHTLRDVNMWAVRWDRDDYTSKDMRPVVDPGGKDFFEYDVGPEPGKFAMGLIHPKRNPRDRNWWELPDIERLRTDSRGMPFGFSESMFLVKPEDVARAERWYRNRSGWTHLFDKYEKFARAAIEATNYFIIHDDDGVGVDVLRTSKNSPVEDALGRGPVVPPTPPPTPPKDPDPPLPPAPDPHPTHSQEFIEIHRSLASVHSKLDRLLNIVMGPPTVPPTPPVPPAPPAPDPPTKRPTDYIPWADRAEWADQLFFAYTTWRGARDLSSIPNAWLGVAGMNRRQLNAVIGEMESVDAKGKMLTHKILTRKHKDFSDRSMVRKSVQKDRKRRLTDQTKIYTGIAARFPVVEECDSIRCKVKKLGKP